MNTVISSILHSSGDDSTLERAPLLGHSKKYHSLNGEVKKEKDIETGKTQVVKTENDFQKIRVPGTGAAVRRF